MTLNKPVVTGIEIHPGDSAGRDIYVDGAFCMTAPAELLARQGVELSAPFGEEERQALAFAAGLAAAKEKAYQYLEYGDMSRRRLMEKLTRFGIEPEVAEAACTCMEELGFIDDERLAGRLANRYAAEKRWGARRILGELMQRGIPAELAKEAVSGLEVDYAASVRYHLERKYRSADLADRKTRQRVTQGLLRLGFDYEDIRSVWDEDD